MDQVVILVGSPGSGKTWVTDQLDNLYHVVENDDFIGQPKYTYENHIIKAANTHNKPVLGNSPFGLSSLMDYLSLNGIKVVPVFIIEPDDVLRKRYWSREKKEIPKGHLTRQHTYLQRAIELKAFSGTSQMVLEHLKTKGIAKFMSASCHVTN